MSKKQREDLHVSFTGGSDLLDQSLDISIDTNVFRVLILLAMTSFVSVWTTGYSKSLIYCLCIFSMIMIVRGRGLSKFGWFSQLGCVIAFVYSLKQYNSNVPSILILIEFTLFIQALQWLGLKKIRDAVGSMVLSLMLMLAVAAMNVNFLFPISLIPFLLVGFICLRLISISRHEKLGVCVDCKKKQPKKAKSFVLVQFTVFFMLFMIFWFFSFYLTPRTKSLGIAPDLGRRKLKGFSGTLNLGEGGFLEDNPTVVLRIRPLEAKSLNSSVVRRLKSWKLRGVTFSDYNKGRWSRLVGRVGHIDLKKSFGELAFKHKGLTNKHAFEISLEDAEPPVVFLPDQIVQASFVASHLLVDESGSLYFSRKSEKRKIYQVKFALNPKQILDESIGYDALNFEFLRYSKSLGIPDRVKKLADSLASDTSSVGQKVARAMKYLNDNCQYSLYEEPKGDEDPISAFIFSSRAGTCEHFASALTLLLRGMNIPARPVAGYTFGDWNETGKFFTVRQRHAHTWVEVLFPNGEWVPFDPTPSLVEDVEEAWLKPFTRLWEMYEGYWFRYVYNFNYKTQANGFRKFMEALKLRFNTSALSAISLLVVLIVLFVLFILNFNSLYNKFFGASYRSWLPLWYTVWAKKQCIKRESWMTPREYHQVLLGRGVYAKADEKYLNKLSWLVDESAGSNNFQKVAILAKRIISKLKSSKKFE
jgi:hypothetical protein